jgi:thioester reductase-like protein
MSNEVRIELLSVARRALLVRLLEEQGVRSIRPLTEALELRTHLRRVTESALPEAMRPRTYTLLSEFPLHQRNGKVDPSQLPVTDPARDRPIIAPRTKTEEDLLKLWHDKLGTPEISVDDDFFLLGGDSIAAVEIAARANRHFGVELPVALIFANSRLEQFAEKIDLFRELVEPRGNDGGLELPTAKLTGHIRLDESIRATRATRAPTSPDRWRSILLTGGTGFFGSHLLVELLQRTRANVHCLVRAPSAEAAMRRLVDTARKYRPDALLEEHRIVPVPGDLALPALGQTAARFQELGRTMDAIVHAGAVVNFAYPLASMRAANVAGVEEILRLAVTEGTKPVHYISTINVFSSTRLTNKQKIAETQRLRDLPSVVGGYAQSRWIGEGLVELARERGVPVSIYRPSIIGGHASTGICNEENVVCRLFKGCVQVGYVPELSAWLNIVTADFAASATAAIALDPSNLGGTFHLVNSKPCLFAELFAALRAFGYALPTVSYREWHRRIEGGGAGNALYPFLPVIAQLGISEPIGLGVPVFDDTNARTALQASGLSSPAIDRDLLARFLEGMVATQGLERPANGVSSSSSDSGRE